MYTWTLLLPAGPLYTGLTDLRAQLVDTDGDNVGGVIDEGFVEVGSNGDYLFTYDEYPSDQTVGVIFYSAGAPSVTLGSVVMNPAELDKNVLADAINARSMSHIDGSAETNSIYELVQGILQSITVGPQWTIYETDGTTPFNERDLTLDDTAKPVTGVA